jgi:hypothetical protein
MMCLKLVILFWHICTINLYVSLNIYFYLYLIYVNHSDWPADYGGYVYTAPGGLCLQGRC